MLKIFLTFPDHLAKYSQVPNKRGGPNKQGGRKKSEI